MIIAAKLGLVVEPPAGVAPGALVASGEVVVTPTTISVVAGAPLSSEGVGVGQEAPASPPVSERASHALEA